MSADAMTRPDLCSEQQTLGIVTRYCLIIAHRVIAPILNIAHYEYYNQTILDQIYSIFLASVEVPMVGEI